MTNRPFRTIAAAGVIFFSLAIGYSAPRQALADSTSVTPPKFELFGNPGDTISDKIKITNQTSSDITYQSLVEDFSANGETGGVNLVEDPKAPSTNFSLAHWMTVEPSRFVVPAGQTTTIDFTVKIPKGAEPGGKYASVLINRAGDKVDGGASVDSRIGSLILLRVSGPITEKLDVETFKTDDSYYQKGPIDFELRTKNSGNVHDDPKGTIVITNIFGKKVKEIPLTDANVLPDSIRRVDTTWSDVPLAGRFTANLVASYGSQNSQLVASTSFTVFPVWLIIATLAVIFILWLLVTQRKSIKRVINRLTSD